MCYPCMELITDLGCVTIHTSLTAVSEVMLQQTQVATVGRVEGHQS